MKVLVINTVNFSLNGITSVIMNYYQEMDKQDIEFDFVTINPIMDLYKNIFIANKSKVFLIERRKNIFKYVITLLKIIRKNKYDIIHVHGNSSLMVLEMFIAKVAGVKIRIAHSHNTQCSHPKLHRLLQPIFLQLCTNYFACGEAAGVWLYGNNKFQVIKNGIVIKNFSFDIDTRREYRKKLNIDNEVLIGNIGHFNTQKNHFFLIETFAEIKKKCNNVKLLLIGDGELLVEVKEFAKNKEVYNDVIFLGNVTDANCYIQAMDIFWLPSLFEGFPMVLVEAQAAGLPCVISDTISKDVDLTNSIKFVSIDNFDGWKKSFFELDFNFIDDQRVALSQKWCRRIEEAGYDVTKNASYMKKIYSSLLHEGENYHG